MSVDFELQTEEGNIIFKIQSGFCTIEVVYNVSDSISKDDWKTFVEALESNKRADLTFSGSGGNVSVSTYKGLTQFFVSNCAEGCNGGDISIKLPNDKCLTAFKAALGALN